MFKKLDMADIVGVDESANIMDSDYVAESLKQQIQIGTQHEHQHEFESENLKDGEIDNQTESQFDPNSLATADSTTNTETFDDEFQFKEISQLSKAEREAEALLDFENEAQCQSESQSGVLGVETGDSAMGLIDVGQDVLNMNLHSNSSGQFDIDAANFNLQSQPEPGIATEGCVDTDPIVSFSNTNDDNALFNDNSPLISGLDVSVVKDQPFAPKSALLELDPQTPNSDVFAGGDNTNINEDVLLLNNEKPLLDGITMDPESTHADVLKPESQFASMPKSAGVAADSPTLLSDDKPVKMPKATTIATPTKSAPTPARCSSSNSAGKIL